MLVIALAANAAKIRPDLFMTPPISPGVTLTEAAARGLSQMGRVADLVVD
jgi:hypothetical protein